MTSRYELDCQEITRICFKSNYDQKTKNKLCEIVEKRMGIEEQKELDGQGDGYYND